MPLNVLPKLNTILLIYYFYISLADPTSKFKPSYPSSGSVRFESSYYPNNYLMIHNGTLQSGSPTNDNDIFESLAVQHAEELAFRQGTDCFIAFNRDGTVYGPCGLTTDDFETHFAKLSV